MTDRAEKSTTIQRTRDGSERGRERGREGGGKGAFLRAPHPLRPTSCRGAEICKRLAARWLDITQAHVREGVRRTRPRPTEDTINLDTGRIKSRIYSPDTERETVLSCSVPSRPGAVLFVAVAHGVGWLISDGRVPQYLSPRHTHHGPVDHGPTDRSLELVRQDDGARGRRLADFATRENRHAAAGDV
ncbi:Uncharacterized protein DBV15_07575 [Temnothorax longispinosus]|uniref:Uncharacterized protein n=1 Tax=Temnothorax longispinosus TaxID=300112 RepID=A0A4S2L580_9HYME|nr:Uncharacterized protein DBV15_07575 [Temnothorax longispinosus]